MRVVVDRCLRYSSAIVIVALAATLAIVAPSFADDTSYVRPYRDAQFRPLNPPMSAGAAAAALWGDPATGPSALLFKMSRGQTPLHIHSSDYHLVVIEGVMKHWVKGESEAAAPQLGPGSYWHIRGNVVHADSCLSDQCVAFIKYEGKRDGKIVE